MKKVVTILFAGLFVFSSHAQTARFHFAEEFYFIKEVPVVNHAGKNFRFEIAVKADPADSLSKVRVHGIGVGKGQEDFLNSDFTVESRVEQDWTIYTVVGKVRTDARRLWFYAAVNGNGSFYFDDLSFYMEEQAGQWKQLRLFNPSFEEKSADIFAGYFVSKRRSANLQTQLSQSIVKTGQRALLVTTKGATPVSMMNASIK